MARQGCDVVDHGWRWLDYHGIDEATEREHIRLSVETIQRLTGTRPIGWYIGTPSANTRRLVVEKGGFLYDSDAYNDELPYWTYDYGRPHLIIPHTLDDNDTRLARGLGWGQAEGFFASDLDPARLVDVAVLRLRTALSSITRCLKRIQACGRYGSRPAHLLE